MIKFEDLIEDQDILKGIQALGYLDPTKIQQKAIPLIKEGKDLIAKSNTGTGKTAAFGLPLIEKLHHKEYKKVVVICPTRELAMQVSNELTKYSQAVHQFKIVTVYGGTPINKQIQALNKGFDILVGTPGRIQDHMRRKVINLKNVDAVVLDEADEMLNMGFIEDIENILSDMQDHQTVLFSATMPKEIRKLASRFLKDQVEIEVRSKHKTVDRITQYYYDVYDGNKDDAVKLLLNYYKSDLSIIFCNTKRKVDELVEQLSKLGIHAVALHGDISQDRRTKIMYNFKHSDKMILIASDVAARGIDVDNIDLVINYDLPQENELYVHRIGRTGRAGKEGLAITLLKTKKDVRQIKQLMKYINTEIEKKDMPTNEEIIQRHNEMFKERVIEESKKGLKDENIQIANELIKAGLEPQDVISALISLANKKPTLPGTTKKKKKARNDNRLATLKLSVGRNQGMTVKKIIDLLKSKGRVNENLIGNIDIQRLCTLVEVDNKDANIIAKNLRQVKLSGKKLNVDFHKKTKRK